MFQTVGVNQGHKPSENKCKPEVEMQIMLISEIGSWVSSGGASAPPLGS